MDSDHREIVELLESVGQGCENCVTLEGECSHCSEVNLRACQTKLSRNSRMLQKLLLEHFQREDELMKLLPRTETIKKHCVRHRGEHVRFSTRYNHVVERLDSCRPGSSSRQFEALVSDWIRVHLLEYDKELSSLLDAAGLGVPGCA